MLSLTRARELDDPASLQTLPESAAIPTVLAEDNDAVHITHALWSPIRLGARGIVKLLGIVAALMAATCSRTSEILRFHRGGFPEFLSGPSCCPSFEKDQRPELESALSEKDQPIELRSCVRA